MCDLTSKIHSSNLSLSFWKDRLSFSEAITKNSWLIKMLSDLEEWLASISTPCCQGHTYSVYKEDLSDKTLLLQKTKTSPKSRKDKTILLLLKILATILIIPRLVAELLRYGLRRCFSFKEIFITPPAVPTPSPSFITSSSTISSPIQSPTPSLPRNFLQLTPPSQTHLFKDPSFLNKQEITTLLEQVLDKIIKKTPAPNIYYPPEYQASGMISFIIKTLPDTIFTTSLPNSLTLLTQITSSILQQSKTTILDLFHRSEKLTQTLTEKKYPHLNISKKRLFEISLPSKLGLQEGLIFIAEERFPLYPYKEHLLAWRCQRKELLEPFKDLMHLILDKDFQFISVHNCLPYKYNNTWSLLLTNPWFGNEPDTSLLKGLSGITDLITHLPSEEALSNTLSLLPQSLLDQKEVQDIAQIRMQELSEITGWENFHIKNQRYPYRFPVLNLSDTDIENLGLPLDVNISIQTDQISIKTAIQDLLKFLNTALQKHTYLSPYFTWKVNEEPPPFLCFPSLEDNISEDTQMEELWIHKILTALKDKGHIYSVHFSYKKISLEKLEGSSFPYNDMPPTPHQTEKALTVTLLI